jgi:hypothetical protein
VEIVEQTNTGTRSLRTLNMDGAEIWVAYHPGAGYGVPRTERLEAGLNTEGKYGPNFALGSRVRKCIKRQKSRDRPAVQ